MPPSIPEVHDGVYKSHHQMTGAACGTTSQAFLTRGGSIVVHPRFPSFFPWTRGQRYPGSGGIPPFATCTPSDKLPFVFAEPPVTRIADHINRRNYESQNSA